MVPVFESVEKILSEHLKKDTEQHFHVTLLRRTIWLTYFSLQIFFTCATQMKRTDWLFFFFYVAVCFAVQESSNFVSKDEIIKCHHLDQGFLEVLSCGAVYFAVQGDPNFYVCG